MSLNNIEVEQQLSKRSQHPSTGGLSGLAGSDTATGLVLRHLLVQLGSATSAAPERVFSLAESICNRRSACLSPDTLDALMFLNANAELQL